MHPDSNLEALLSEVVDAADEFSIRGGALQPSREDIVQPPLDGLLLELHASLHAVHQLYTKLSALRTNRSVQKRVK
jgi:hypothetical protein